MIIYVFRAWYMDLLTKAHNLLARVTRIRQDYKKLSDILSLPEIYSDKKYSLYLLSSKQKIESIENAAKDLEDAIELQESEDVINESINKLDRELVKHEADSTTECIVEFEGDAICINIVKKDIDEQIKNNRFSVKKEDKWLINGFGSYVCLKEMAGKHIFKGEIKGNALIYVYASEKVPIFDEKDVAIDYFHSDGAGGQNVNKVETGIRATHMPTGIVVTCRDERSQLMNKRRALEKLEIQVKEYYEKEISKKIKDTKAKEKDIIAAQYRDGTKV